MHNLNDKAAASGNDAIPSSAGAQAAQSLPFSKTGNASASSASADLAAASAKRAVDDAHGSTGRAGDAGDDFVERLIEGAHAAIDKLADAAGPTADRIAGAFSNPSGKASRLLGQAGDKRDAWLSDVRDIVRQHPIAAIAIALAAGAVYVKLTATPSRDPRDGVDD